jgi:hypothetical protein
MKSMQALILEEEEKVPEVTEGSDLVIGYELQYLSNTESQSVHKVEVKTINFQDLFRHLRQGDTVLITPKLHLHRKKKQDQAPWYFAHM